MAGGEIALEFTGAGVPSRAFGPRAAGLRTDLQRPVRSPFEIAVERTRQTVIDDIDRARHRIRRDRHAARHRFEIHEAECIGETREDQHVRGGQMRGEIFAEPIARIDGTRILRPQSRQLRTVTDDELRSSPRHAEKRVDVLLDRHAPDVGRDRPRILQKSLIAGSEQLRVHATMPVREIPETARRELVAHRLRAHHATLGGAVKPEERQIGRPHGDRVARAQILRKLRVIRRREAQAMRHAIAPGRETQRSLGRNMQCFRLERRDARGHLPIREDGDADFGIRGTRESAEFLRGHVSHLVTEPTEPFTCLPQRLDDPVGLGEPRVRHDHDPHVPPRLLLAVNAG